MQSEKFWEEKLQAALERSLKIEDILDVAYEALGNPIVVIDLAYHLIAHTENTVADDPLWNELTTLGMFSHETVNFFNEAKFISAYAESSTVSLMKNDGLKYDRACGIIFDHNGIQLGSIVVKTCYRPFRQEDFKLMEKVCECLAEALQAKGAYDNIVRVFEDEDTVISDLIEDKYVDKDLLEETLERLYANMKRNLYVAVVDVIQYESTLTHLAYFKDLFKRLQGEYEYFVYLNNIVIIVSTDNATLNIERDLNGLHKFFEKYQIFAGVSSSFQNLMDIQKYYREALTALNYGLSTGLDINIFMYDDFRLEHFLKSVRDTMDIKELINPLALLMQEYDDNNGTDYLELLYAYLLNGRNAPLVAQKLGIEEKDLQRRLEDAKEIFNLDWNNGVRLYSLVASLRILKCYC